MRALMLKNEVGLCLSKQAHVQALAMESTDQVFARWPPFAFRNEEPVKSREDVYLRGLVSIGSA